ncbi:hypothetical protein C1X64_14380 [Pseudomonas sp. GW456-E7]|nr:hypothetical protein C1X64_14380 [Pseudomonas sp. GW456-E7]
MTADIPVGASLLAMVVNDDAGCLNGRVVLTFFASRLAPTGGGFRQSTRVSGHWPAPRSAR